MTPVRTRARAIDAIADGVKRGLAASKFVRELAAGTDAESRWQGRRRAEMLATVADARALRGLILLRGGKLDLRMEPVYVLTDAGRAMLKAVP